MDESPFAGAGRTTLPRADRSDHQSTAGITRRPTGDWRSLRSARGSVVRPAPAKGLSSIQGGLFSPEESAEPRASLLEAGDARRFTNSPGPPLQPDMTSREHSAITVLTHFKSSV